MHKYFMPTGLCTGDVMLSFLVRLKLKLSVIV